MNLHEYQARALLQAGGVPVPDGDVASTPDQVEKIATRLGGGVVVKAQVHTGGRGKAGGVKLVKNAAEARAAAEVILGMDIKGLTVEKVLVAPAADIASESVKQVIKKLVGAEDCKAPYSDQKIVKILAERDIKIARRTVAKYREMLGILSSSKRKKYF